MGNPIFKFPMEQDARYIYQTIPKLKIDRKCYFFHVKFEVRFHGGWSILFLAASMGGVSNLISVLIRHPDCAIHV
jgi:hypothetical protein